MPCPRCNSEVVMKDGTTQLGGQRFRCRSAGWRALIRLRGPPRAGTFHCAGPRGETNQEMAPEMAAVPERQGHSPARGMRHSPR